ncbi:hypothetical protein [Isoalcanivorax beigongshangi]|uniref:Uncharacterized protein n=1 Tax=Isoalcanivorax beigongshangi TaxID=3238810 RepID=A0ABV4AH98_9GAMM
MGTLHWVGFPPARQDLLQQLHASVGPQDTLLLVDAGLLHARHPALLAQLPTPLPCHCFGPSAAATPSLDAAALAELCVRYPRHLNWWP